MGEHGREMSRRVLLRGAAVTGVAAPLLAACASDEEPSGSADASGTASETGGETDGSPEPADPGAGGTTVATSDVPVEGGVILADDMVVVTQPAEGEFKAFSAVCTHQGCPVQQVNDGQIQCNCHGSAFSIEDGSVVNGPASRPLESKSVTVDGETVRVS
jgi:Rieske Fe-S protein